MNNEILKEFNAECVSCFLDLIIDKNPSYGSDGAKWYETFVSEHEISQHCLIMLDNHRVIPKEFYI
ncbi:MAG: hypothetical protein ACTS73_06285 [Arsenophonus sp. NEOnobi-MAG3]